MGDDGMELNIELSDDRDRHLWLKDGEVCLKFTTTLPDEPPYVSSFPMTRAQLWDLYNNLGKYLASKMQEEGC